MNEREQKVLIDNTVQMIEGRLSADAAEIGRLREEVASLKADKKFLQEQLLQAQKKPG